MYFDAGARRSLHTHPTDQLLYFLEGEGVVGTRTERRIYRVGGMAVIPADEWHWHGATPTSPMCHLSMPGGPSVWGARGADARLGHLHGIEGPRVTALLLEIVETFDDDPAGTPSVPGAPRDRADNGRIPDLLERAARQRPEVRIDLGSGDPRARHRSAACARGARPRAKTCGAPSSATGR